MPRKVAYDQERLIEIAMDLFWRRGFAATSMTDIVRATGVNPGSLYSAFSDKDALFIAALRKYVSQNLLGRMPLGAIGSAAIKTWISSLYEDLRADESHRGCFLINTIADRDSRTASVGAYIDARIADIERFFRKNLEFAVAEGEMPAETDVAQLTHTLLGATVAMLTLARLPSQSEALTSVYQTAIKTLP